MAILNSTELAKEIDPLHVARYLWQVRMGKDKIDILHPVADYTQRYIISKGKVDPLQAVTPFTTLLKSIELISTKSTYLTLPHCLQLSSAVRYK